MPSDVLTTVSDITRLTPAQIRASSAEERNKLYGDVAKNPDFAKRFKEFNISSREQLASTVESSLKKGWFAEYVKGEKGLMSFGTLGKILSMKPVEGVVNAVTFNKLPILGKIARWSAVAASIYFGINLIKGGAQTAYEGGNILLDRMGPGGGHLVPPMDLPPAPYQLQPLPSANPWGTA